MGRLAAGITRDDLNDDLDDDDLDYDLVVVGGGAAGLSAAKIAARSRRSVLVVDGGQPRNAAAVGVHNYLYAEGAAPADLRATGRAEARSYGVAIHDGPALAVRVLDGLRPDAARFTVTLGVSVSPPGERTVRARRLVLATGLVDGLPALPGLAEGWGRDVLHCPFCHGWEVRDQAIGVIATGPTAVHQAGLFRALSEDVVVFWPDPPGPSDGDRERLAAAGIGLVEARVEALERVDGELTGVRLADGRVIARHAVTVTPLLHARADLLDDLGLVLTDLVVQGTVVGSYLATGATGVTAVPGVWAAGNLTDPMAQVITAAAAGAAAGAAAHADLLAEDTELALARFREKRLTTAEGFWESHHRGRLPGQRGPNPVLVDVVAALPPTSALDLGCGDGGDALWLAQRGWQVTAVDVSATAVDRLARRAQQAGVFGRVRAERHDLAASLPDGTFELVSAQYLHSPVTLPRADVLRRAADKVLPGGLLLVVDHASAPPWSWADPDTVFPSPAETLDELGLDTDSWTVLRLEAARREAVGPDGQRATVTDNVLALRRQDPGE